MSELIINNVITMYFGKSIKNIRQVQITVLCKHFQMQHFSYEPVRPTVPSERTHLASTLLWFHMCWTHFSTFRARFLRPPSRWNRSSGGSIGASPGGPGGPAGPAGPCSPFVPATPSEPLGPGGPSKPGNPGGPSLPFCPWGPTGPCNNNRKCFPPTVPHIRLHLVRMSVRTSCSRHCNISPIPWDSAFFFL
jgi:hypothetical protein